MNKSTKKLAPTAKERRKAPLLTPSDLKAAVTTDVSAAMNGCLADVFALYMKTEDLMRCPIPSVLQRGT